MNVNIIIAASLRTFTNRTPEVPVQAGTVSEALRALTDEYPEAAKGLFDENGDLRGFVSVYVDDHDIRTLKGLSTKLADGDEIWLIPAVAGGACESVISTERMKEVKIEEKEIRRYNNHLQLKEISIKGQKRIMAGRVLVAGVGALGGVVAERLAAAGVGTIGLTDDKEVSLESLQVQTMHSSRDIDRPRVASAKDRIKKLNPTVTTVTWQDKLSADNVEEIISDFDIVVDTTDSFVTRYLISDACALHGIPEVFGAMYQFEGFVTVLNAKDGPCYRCLYPSPPPAGIVPSCAASGVMNALPGIVGAMMAAEVLKLLTGSGEPLIGKAMKLDTWDLRYRVLHTARDKGCPVCGAHPSIHAVHDIDYEDFCGLREDPHEEPIEGIEPEELARRIANDEKLTIIDVREPHERAIQRFPGTLAIPIGQLARRQKELDPEIDTIFVCKEGKRSILAIRTLREAGYTGPMYNLKGGLEKAAQIIFPNEGAWL